MRNQLYRSTAHGPSTHAIDPPHAVHPHLPVTRPSLAATRAADGTVLPSSTAWLCTDPAAFSHDPTGSAGSEMCTAAPGPRSGVLGLRLYLQHAQVHTHTLPRPGTNTT
jgi:hypothetical protein